MSDLATALISSIDSLITGVTPSQSTQQAYAETESYSPFAVSGSWSNTSAFASVNPTCKTVFPPYTGCAISKRHLLTCAHAYPSTLTSSSVVVWFFDSSGNAYSIPVLYSMPVYPGTPGQDDTTLADDLCLLVLGSDVPSSIPIAQVLPANWRNWLMGTPTLPVAWVSKENNWYVSNLVSYGFDAGAGTDWAVYQPTESVRQPWWEQAVPGNSGNPVFLLLGSQPILLGTWHSYVNSNENTFPSISDNIPAINSAMTTLSLAAGLSTNYQLTPVNLSAYTEYTTMTLLYWYATSSQSWTTVGNWYLDAGHSNAAGGVPNTSTGVVILGSNPPTTGPGSALALPSYDWSQVTSATVSDASFGGLISIANGGTLVLSARVGFAGNVGSGCACTVGGFATFSGNSSSGLTLSGNGLIAAGAYVTSNVISTSNNSGGANAGTIYGNLTCSGTAGNSGTVSGTFLSTSTAPLSGGTVAQFLSTGASGNVWTGGTATSFNISGGGSINGNVSGSGIFTGSGQFMTGGAYTLTGNVTFGGTTSVGNAAAKVAGNATFTGSSSFGAGTITGNAIFQGASATFGTYGQTSAVVNGNATFTGGAIYQGGTVGGVLTMDGASENATIIYQLDPGASSYVLAVKANNARTTTGGFDS